MHFWGLWGFGFVLFLTSAGSCSAPKRRSTDTAESTFLSHTYGDKAHHEQGSVHHELQFIIICYSSLTVVGKAFFFFFFADVNALGGMNCSSTYCIGGASAKKMAFPTTVKLEQHSEIALLGFMPFIDSCPFPVR